MNKHDTVWTKVILKDEWSSDFPKDFIVPGQESIVESLVSIQSHIEIVKGKDYITIPMFKLGQEEIDIQKQKLLTMAKKYKSFSQCIQVIQNDTTGLAILNCVKNDNQMKTTHIPDNPEWDCTDFAHPAW